MKKSLFFVMITLLALTAPSVAEEAVTAPEAVAAPVEALPAQAATVVEPALPAAEPVVDDEAPISENLEFVSGEVTAVNEASKSVTVKLYGETDGQASDKTLTVTVDANTDITDGEKDRDLKSLTATTEVDVEYDPASNKATYIFVY